MQAAPCGAATGAPMRRRPSRRLAPRARPPAAKTAPAPAMGKKAAMPADIVPCLATLVEEVPKGEGWLHEIKWDGYRLIAFVKGGKAQLKTRNGHDWTHRFPTIAKAPSGLPVETPIVD